MKKLKKLGINKVTLRNLDQPSLDGVAAGCCVTEPNTRCHTCAGNTCVVGRTCQTATCMKE